MKELILIGEKLKFLVKTIQIKSSLTASLKETDERVDTDHIKTEVPDERDPEIVIQSSPTASPDETDKRFDTEHIKTEGPDENGPAIAIKSSPTASPKETDE